MPTAVKLPVTEATPISFKDFGQVIEPVEITEEFGLRDAQLELSRGIPRLQILHLHNKSFEFSGISHHANVTQCLGSIGAHVWYLGVAKGTIVNPSEIDSDGSKKVIRSSGGHYYVPPVADDVRVFRISGTKFIKLDIGTWHDRPLFKSDTMDFYNLLLSDTNEVDQTDYDFGRDGVVFSFED